MALEVSGKIPRTFSRMVAKNGDGQHGKIPAD